MSFVKNLASDLLRGGLLGIGLGALLGKKKKGPIQPQQVTRDDAATEAARDQELARRRGAYADYTAGGGGEPIGGIGRFVAGS